VTQQTIDRVEASKRHLLAGLPIWRAAIMVGWASPQLQIAFKKVHGITPGEWLWSLPGRVREKVYRRTLEHSSIYGGIKHRKGRESARSWMCRSCGSDAGDDKPARCGKCGSYSFEMSAPAIGGIVEEKAVA
jgi:predicted Zn-ribbon and HTH transcriptional regulator